jgi:hypothetical protein
VQPKLIKVKVRYTYTIEVGIPEDELDESGEFPYHIVAQYTPTRAKCISWEILDKEKNDE